MNLFRVFVLLQYLMMLNTWHSAKAQSNDTIEIPPEYIGGQQQLNFDIKRYLLYPENAKTRNVQGDVIVEFEVDSNGKVQNARIREGIIPSMDSAALAVVYFIDNWKPGLLNGIPVKTNVTLPIKFNLLQTSFYSPERIEQLKAIVKTESQIIQYITQDSIEHLRNTLQSYKASFNDKYFQIINHHGLILLSIIARDYLNAGLLIKDYKIHNINKISLENDYRLYNAINIYLRLNYDKLIQDIISSSANQDLKNMLILFMEVDQLKDNQINDVINAVKGNSEYSKSYTQRRSEMGYKYLKYAIDTTYNDYVRKKIVAERRFKYFSWGFGLGYAKIIHNNQNHLIYSNPQGLSTHFDFYYKRFYASLMSNILYSKNYDKITIDTFNLKPQTKLGNTYAQIGLGYRFYLTDLIHFVPYFAYNAFNVNYLHEISEEKSITKSKNFETNFAMGCAINFSFSKNKAANYKPANYTPLGLSIRYSQIIPSGNYQQKNVGHFFSITFSILFITPKNRYDMQYYFMYR